ncbi:GTP 3',8-cyclase MoaA [Sphingobium sp. AP50]|uniref:GTP 3',8-cyclase MoaA n=1 Tax=Sphingobium sp. AP50 TaxID=1884369 RepID=UPI000B84527F|nr:GTP 3',8-cyclase MoaA [Sphingobium sp. AP50]
MAPQPASALADGFGRRITYLRLSVTDRCDLRCRYCMSETMRFLPRADLLSVEEMALISERLIARGVRRIRLTGGEPLTRRGLPDLAHRLGYLLATSPLEEVTLTTNGTRLAQHAALLADVGVRRINVSLDTRDAALFRHITRTGDLGHVLDGIEAARTNGIRIKINMVALAGLNDQEFGTMLRWCGDEGHDLTLIETMPLGVVEEDRTDRYLSLETVRADLEGSFALRPSTHRTGGPARYFELAGTSTRLGLITPMSGNFCEGCNRIRLTADGQLTMCLGHEDYVDLKTAYRDGGMAGLDAGLDEALRAKPPRHLFEIGRGIAPSTARHMSATGG